MVVTLQEFHAPPQDMVREVINIIDGYRMGPLRALAQEPPQNSLDARKTGTTGPVKVEYRLYQRQLMSGELFYLMTVTDCNTTGLQGPALSKRDLQERAQITRYLQLMQNENWAAWEAMGFSKEGDDTLGTRGQGKSAFLYHSRHDSGIQGPGGRCLERMIILYDTLLDDGTYRLGVRLAQPDDGVLYPPSEGQAARAIVSNSYSHESWSGPSIPLELTPLENVGARIIVPFLSSEAVDAIRDGTLVRWLERCWWRAIQLSELEITVITDSNKVTVVGVPQWWAGQPWTQQPLPSHLYLQERIPLIQDPALRIKRIVLMHSDDLKQDEIEDTPEQNSGVQLLRRGQWIETLGASEKYGDYIPRDKRAGFRGFVEFERNLERQLRAVETSQHDGFRRQRTFVREIDAHIKEAVRAFATGQGWLPSAQETPRDDVVAEELLRQVTDTFLVQGDARGRTRRSSSVIWTCELDVDFPSLQSTRVEWNQTLTNILAVCRHAPANARREVEATLYLVDPDGHRQFVGSLSRRTRDGEAIMRFRDLTPVRVARHDGEVPCLAPGKYRLLAEFVSEGSVVGRVSRTFYLRSDPPTVQPRPFSVHVAVTNASTGAVRVNAGEAINIAVTVTNRSPDNSRLRVDASLGTLLFADSTEIEIHGRLPGDTPASEMLTYTNVLVYTSEPTSPSTANYVVLSPGRHLIRADVRDEGGTNVASTSTPVFVEEDPETDSRGAPFEVRALEEPGIPYPIWELSPPHGNTSSWTLWYARHHPTFLAAEAADRISSDRLRLYGTRLFWVETFCATLVEWALVQFRERGDEAPFSLLEPEPVGSTNTYWQRYQTALQNLIDGYAEPVECLELQRRVVSLMLYLVQEEMS